MRCLKPFIATGCIAYPCGQCTPCRINRRRIWVHRLMLERMQHLHATFVTLTYAQVEDGASLEPRDLQLFLKRVRRAFPPKSFRFYAVGEYGEETWRPHFHVALFGMQCVLDPGYRSNCQCPACSFVRGRWKLGHVLLQPLNEATAQYMCGYVLKKMTSAKDARLAGRLPEFARMSLRPGIGADAIPDVASAMMQYRLEEKMVDVPQSLAHGKKELPLGRYLRRRLRLQCGLPENAPAEVIEALRQGLLPVFDYARANTPKGSPGLFREVCKQTFEQLNDQAVRNATARDRIRKKGERL